MHDLREQFAELAHDQWAEWMRYMFGKSVEESDGSVKIPTIFVQRWKRQMNTAYSELPESEKESDRVIADKYLQILNTSAGS